MTATATRTRSHQPAAALPTLDVDAAGLAAMLRRQVKGEVRFDAGSRHLWSTDSSNYRQIPIGVALPRDVEDVVHIVAACREFGAPITCRGGGTSLAGQSTNVAVVLDFSKYMREVLELDPEQRWARVQPGCVLDDLQAAALPHGLRFGPDPSTHNRCTLGGMIGNDSCGVHSIEGRRTVENVLELDVLLYDGTRLTVGPTGEQQLQDAVRGGGRTGALYRSLRDLRDRYADEIRSRYPGIPRRVSGYNLDNLLPEKGFNVARALTGSEGTCVTVLEAKVALIEHHPARAILVLGFDDIVEAAQAVPEVLQHGPIGLEGIDQPIIANMRAKGLYLQDLQLLPEGCAYLLCEFGAARLEEADDQARELLRALDIEKDRSCLLDADEQQAMLWEIREAGLGATARVPGRPLTWPGWEDSAVAPDRVAPYLRDLHALFEEYRYHDVALYGHFGDGCVHCRIPFDLRSADGVAAFRAFMEDAADLVVSHGGSLSGEHGDGQARAELLPRMFGEDLVTAFRRFKTLWDPDGKMNPGKVVDPYRLDQNLRLGTDYRPLQPSTAMAYPEDHFSFAEAQLRCVGVGKCRRDDDAGTMCPSYMVTHEEKHSTRGRARLLFEMLQPDSLLDGWRDEHVREALDLCLACKGCKGDCPVSVDMATYKAEFLHHHFRGRLRPRAAYALGLIYWWSRIATRLPGLSNALLDAPLVSGVLKRAAGVAPQRPAPAYAGETFVDWFSSRPAGDDAKPRVLLFPDTFTNHFEPEIGAAAVAVLEDAGWQVTIPTRALCCGRPLYDFGMLDLARRQLHQLVSHLRDDVSAGVHVVGLEPSCVAVLRDELQQMLPNDEDARRLREQTHTLAEFLVDVAHYRPPALRRSAVVHAHCHQKAVMGLSADAALMDAMGLDWRDLDAGCCGLAGSFGFEAGEKYDVSVKAGERKLLPAVRDASDDTLIIADGFSCRTQIHQLQHRRRALHLAQVLQMAREEGPEGPNRDEPVEARYVGDPHPGLTRNDWAVLAAAAGGLLGLVALRQLQRRAGAGNLR